MNKFTKEELENLEELLSDAPEFFDEESFGIFNLHEKVKSMIDNYCEQEQLDDYDLFLPKVGVLLTHEDISSDAGRITLIKKLYLETVYPEKVNNHG